MYTAAQAPQSVLLAHDKLGELTAHDMLARVRACASFLRSLDVRPDDRVAVFLPKIPETALAFYAASYAGAVFVPVNPVLKAAQVAHILADCDVRVLITSPERLQEIEEALGACRELRHVVLVGGPARRVPGDLTVHDMAAAGADSAIAPVPRIDNDMAAILYTSGSTGRPKGVVISHRNIVTGAMSVARFLELNAADRLLAVLPFSFDYGLNQLTTAVLVGARCVLFDYLLPRDVVRAVARHTITGLAAVPPLWAQLAPLQWPEPAQASLRYITNSGGAMPPSILARLRAALPRTAPYLMYGLTEAFRSTYLPPSELDRRPDSMGKAIPNAEIMVVRPDGSRAEAGEPGELVHRGALVALGYWNDPARTAERYKPVPGQLSGLPLTELAVWSGDTVRADAEGFLYFVGRTDAMIKTSGYRVSPEEVEEIAYRSGHVQACAAIGVPHPTFGQGIALVIQTLPDAVPAPADLLAIYRREVPNYLVPLQIVVRNELPYNPNGKINRNALADEYAHLFEAVTAEGN